MFKYLFSLTLDCWFTNKKTATLYNVTVLYVQKFEF